ncbi:MarR family transcriptional regulator [Lentilactobacillus sp. Marseille-Q4993]|uniref:MarR family winged helix-turn-helix transcriptional regulator n=1 Tax=Lentilactobacillus sp. Marseille-Q4993 TaxID=3039492 RepID=UPI0024BD0AB7|nr:MarR family transcriptional regulator [Lentilactobacillus sp. Marseille-Q4993]
MDSSQTATMIYQIYKLGTGLLAKRLRKHKLNVDQAVSVLLIAKYNKINQQEIGTKIGRSAASMSNLMKSLETRGFIFRIPDSRDDREKNLKLTAVGTKIAIEIKKEFDSISDLIEDILEDRESLVSELENIRNQFRQMEDL